MWRYLLFIWSCVRVLVGADPLEPHFRNDYKYMSRQETFYKVHPTAQPWSDAYARCVAEGAELAYPRSDSEAAVFVTLMREKNVNYMWVGAHDLYAEGIYLTLDGQDICNSYENWSAGEPNDANYSEDCILISKDSLLNDQNCNSRLPFICKKTLDTLTSNPTCETADLAYIPDVAGGRCYKLHTQAKNWTQAFSICHAEQSYLAEINNQKEADFLVKMLESFPENELKGNFDKTHIAIGFNDLFVEGEYRTTHGKTLQQTGYVDWYTNQPDDYQGNEDCGSIYRNGKLNDINCGSKMMFICEREIGDPNVVHLFSRFKETRVNVE